jgi:hypothetical protein
MQGSEPVTGKMPVPQVLLLKGQHYSLIVIDVLFSVKGRSRILINDNKTYHWLGSNTQLRLGL